MLGGGIVVGVGVVVLLMKWKKTENGGLIAYFPYFVFVMFFFKLFLLDRPFLINYTIFPVQKAYK